MIIVIIWQSDKYIVIIIIRKQWFGLLWLSFFPLVEFASIFHWVIRNEVTIFFAVCSRQVPDFQMRKIFVHKNENENER